MDKALPPLVLVVVAVVALLVYFLFFRKKTLPDAGKAAPVAPSRPVGGP